MSSGLVRRREDRHGGRGLGTHLSTATRQSGRKGWGSGRVRPDGGKRPPSCTLVGQQRQLVSLSEKQIPGDKPAQTSTNTLSGVWVERPGGDALADGGLHPAVRKGSRGWTTLERGQHSDGS